MKYLLFSLLARMARRIVRIHQPYIIWVTATAWKTTITKNIHLLLSSCFPKESVYISPYHYNGEYGLPLSILMSKNPGYNIFMWIYVFTKSILLWYKKYPKYLVLEYGIDHPGEMDYLLSIALPDLAIIWPISPNHIEQFGTFESYKNEKLKLATTAKQVIAYDALWWHWANSVSTYGLSSGSDFSAHSLRQYPDSLRCVISSRGHQSEVSIPLFWEYQILNVLPLFAVAEVLGIQNPTVLDILSRLTTEEGRSRILRGYRDSIVIDGSYNGWFLAMTEWLETLSHLEEEFDIVVLLGDMRELWPLSEKLHQDLARCVDTLFASSPSFRCILVWPLMWQYVLPELSLQWEVAHFLSSRDAGEHIRSYLDHAQEHKKQKVIYVKWSQNTIFLEEAIKRFLAPDEDTSLLCRQSKEWMKKKESFFRALDI